MPNLIKSFKTVEIEQRFEYGFTPEVCKAVLDGWTVVKDYAWIVHDKDLKDDGTPKEPHIHCMIRFNDSVPTTAIINRVKAVTGTTDLDRIINYEQLQKCHKWKSAIAYLTHENVTGKHVYDRNEVVSNYQFEQDINDALSDKNKLDLLLQGIADGTVKKYNIYEHCSVQDYAKWRQKIDSGFDYRNKMLLNKGDRDMKAIFIQGDAGTGKTTFAKMTCEEKDYSYYVSSGSNDVLDGYGGQDAIILDDLRPSALRLADLLKMLDNNTASSVPSRYSNKVLECRLIIITTILDIDTFFNQVFTEEKETIKQLKRRCETIVKMDYDTMTMGVYDRVTGDYIYTPKLPNPVAMKFGLDKKTTINIMRDSLNDMFGKLVDVDNALQELQKKDDFDYVGNVDDIPFLIENMKKK